MRRGIGRAWESVELDRVAELCVRHHVILVSDEIHSDFVFSGHTFTSAAIPMGRLGALEQLVVCTSASKSYNNMEMNRIRQRKFFCCRPVSVVFS